MIRPYQSCYYINKTVKLNYKTDHDVFFCRKAEPLYKEAVQLKKQLKIVKKSDGCSSSSDDGMIEGRLSHQSSDVEVKYKLHICYMNMNQVI